MRVVVLGASPNPERYSNRAVRELRRHGHEVIPVNPGHATIQGLPVAPRLGAVEGAVDTVTVYVNPKHMRPLIDELAALQPRRVILNPGADDAAIRQELEGRGLHCVEACTLVMLRTGQF